MVTAGVLNWLQVQGDAVNCIKYIELNETQRER